MYKISPAQGCRAMNLTTSFMIQMTFYLHLNAVGVIPVDFLNKELKYATSSIPTLVAISPIG